MLHQLHREQIIPASLDIVWDFFSNPNNLNQITPPDLYFEIYLGRDQDMYQGQLIAYRIQLLPLVKTNWLTEITQVKKPFFFADQQHLGPYTFWNHEHHFQTVEGGVKMVDLVTYQLPFGPLGEVVHKLWVDPRLKRIFDFRAKKISHIFGESPP
jgi:ligand-binding SRPBCC domain-containing protein